MKRDTSRFVKFRYEDFTYIGFIIKGETQVNSGTNVASGDYKAKGKEDLKPNTNKIFVATIRQEKPDEDLRSSKVVSIPMTEVLPFKKPVIMLYRTFLLQQKNIIEYLGKPSEDVCEMIMEKANQSRNIRVVNDPQYFQRLHTELHKLKSRLEINRLMNVKSDQDDERRIEEILKLLWYKKHGKESRVVRWDGNDEDAKHYNRRLYPVTNPKPLGGGRFSPR